MLSPKIKRNISRIIPFGVFWVIFGLIFSIIEKGVLGDLDYYPSTKNPYNFSGMIFINAASTLVAGLFLGTIEILYFSKLFTQTCFSKKIVYKTTIYLVIIFIFLLVFTLISNSVKFQTNLFDKDVWFSLWAFLSNFAFWSVVLYISAIIPLSLFYAEVSDNLGQGVLINFFTGKYHTPTEEERIFMFLDMKSSTTIAEKLGHVSYFELLREYYSDLSDSIIEYSGEIYQYIGDEIVVSWKLKPGLHNNNCVQCFYAIRDSLNKQAEKYNKKFGLLPTFKAGFHFGKVTTGEIGVIKKAIIFTGDVLNTTARIQGLCNYYKADLLISHDLMEKLNLGSKFQIKSLGEKDLRGRDKKVELFTVLKNS